MKTIDELGISPWPWSLTDDAGIISKYGEVISGQYGPYNWNNARLLSAAPELYECLRKLLDSYDHSPWGEVLEQKIKEALEKAGGAE